MTYPFVSLGEVVASSTGTANPGKAPLDTFRYVDVAAVDNGQKRIVGTRDVLGSEAPSRARKLISANDVLVSTVRPNLNAVAIVPAILQGAIASTGFSVLRATPAAMPEFIFYFVQSQRFIESLCKLTAGALYPAVTDRQVLEQRLPLPPLPEQRRIVDILSRAESIVRLRREAQKKSAELIPALFTDLFGDPATNPKGWPMSTLGQHVTIESPVRTPNHDADANFLCIGADSIESATGRLLATPTVRDVRPISGKYWFEAGDVLYSKIRPYLAKATLIENVGFCSADIYPLRCTSSLRPPYLQTLLLGEAFTEYATSESVRVSMPKLNRAALFKYKFPAPPIELQTEFAEKFATLRSIQAQQATATTQAEATFNALLAQVFSGS